MEKTAFPSLFSCFLLVHPEIRKYMAIRICINIFVCCAFSVLTDTGKREKVIFPVRGKSLAINYGQKKRAEHISAVLSRNRMELQFVFFL